MPSAPVVLKPYSTVRLWTSARRGLHLRTEAPLPGVLAPSREAKPCACGRCPSSSTSPDTWPRCQFSGSLPPVLPSQGTGGHVASVPGPSSWREERKLRWCHFLSTHMNACSFQVGFMHELQAVIYVAQPLFPPKVSHQSFHEFYYMKTPDPVLIVE